MYTIEKIKEMLIDSSADEHYIISCQPTPISGRGWIGKMFTIYHHIDDTNRKRCDITVVAESLRIDEMIKWLNSTGQRYINHKLELLTLAETEIQAREISNVEFDEELDLDNDDMLYDMETFGQML